MSELISFCSIVSRDAQRRQMCAPSLYIYRERVSVTWFDRNMTSIHWIDIDECMPSRCIRLLFLMFFSHLDTRLDAILSKNLQHRRSLDEITKCTRFSKSEVRLLYRSFKQVCLTLVIYAVVCIDFQECPGGNVSEERLREIYLQFFPQGSRTTTRGDWCTLVDVLT